MRHVTIERKKRNTEKDKMIVQEMKIGWWKAMCKETIEGLLWAQEMKLGFGRVHTRNSQRWR